VNPDILTRFWSRVHGANHESCWIWRGAVDRYGYGKFFYGQRTATAHKVAYEHLVHDVPANLELDHLCRTRLCVNPWHLEPVTHRVNVARRVAFIAHDPGSRFCINGHLKGPTNTYVAPSGQRYCRPCNAAAQARRKARKKAAA
jgi:hypothetical protein